MPFLQCQTCEEPVFEFYSVLDLCGTGKDSEIEAANKAHAPKCSGKKPAPKPREELPHRYTDGRPFAFRPKGPCAVCGLGARNVLHYQDGRYL